MNSLSGLIPFYLFVGILLEGYFKGEGGSVIIVCVCIIGIYIQNRGAMIHYMRCESRLFLIILIDVYTAAIWNSKWNMDAHICSDILIFLSPWWACHAHQCIRFDTILLKETFRPCKISKNRKSVLFLLSKFVADTADPELSKTTHSFLQFSSSFNQVKHGEETWLVSELELTSG